ncbi:DUF3224 domain-containing protein [Caulobacter henricii]|nr:DUF3224 domain-containing protein [Caulobacter henricii]
MPVPRLLAVTLLASLAFTPAGAKPPSAPLTAIGATAMTQHARGPFDVKLVPQDEDAGPGSTLGRLSLDKVFHGDLDATGKGQMLTAGTDTPGSAVYVAIERVTGTLHGKAGSFALVHKGLMRGADRQLTVEIVPDSGTGALKGISGSLAIEITGGKHLYDLTYTLPAQ